MEIEAKAYMGRKDISSFAVPENTAAIGDWAFAGCTALCELRLPRVSLGKGVFKGCESLKYLWLYDEAAEDCAALLAEAGRQDMSYLLNLSIAGTDEWYEAWDAWLLRVLGEPDADGYSGQLPSGEEDYSAWDAAGYESARRRDKARRCLLRLIYPKHLSSSMRDKLCAYIAGHTYGSPAGDEAWQLILSGYADEERWYEAFAGAGGINEENASGILAAIPERFVKMKSAFIRFYNALDKDIFSTLKL